MERGFYHNGDGDIVYGRNRKPIDPDNLTWVPHNDPPAFLRQYGVFLWKWDGSNIIPNTEIDTKISERQADTDRRNEIEVEQATSGMKGDSISGTQDKISDIFKAIRAKPTDPEKLNALINKCEIIFKKIAIEILE